MIIRHLSGRPCFLYVALAVMGCVWLVNLPLRGTDLWDHVNYGRITIASDTWPDQDPLLPLAAKSEFINPAWGSQLVMASLIDSPWLGLAAMQLLHAFLILACVGIIGYAVGCQSGSGILASAAAGCFLWINWQQFLIVRPQTVGLFFYCLLFCLLQLRFDRFRIIQVAICLLFLLWVNLHGSFTMGLFLIGITGMGRLADDAMRVWVVRKRWLSSHRISNQLANMSLISGLRRSGFLRLLVLGCLCAVAATLNPAGVDIYEEVLRVGSHPNMANMIEWKPLSLDMKQGRAAAICFGVLIATCVVGRRRLQAGPIFLFFLTGILMLWSSRMINWWAPIASYLIGVQGASAVTQVSRLWRQQNQSAPKPLRRHWYFDWNDGVCLLIAVTAVTFGSAWGKQIAGRPQPERQILAQDTPSEIADFLAEQPGLIDQIDDGSNHLLFCPAEWTGYLMSETRECLPQANGEQRLRFRIRPMVSTHVHVIPPKVWNHFLAIHQGHRLSLKFIDDYKINVLIVERQRQTALLNQLRRARSFSAIFECRQAVVFQRNSENTMEEEHDGRRTGLASRIDLAE